MSISIIIPAYNSDRYIVEALDSITKHNECDLEIIVIDDGSSDDTKSLVENYISEDCRVRYVYQSNQGQSVARNVGQTLANKDYVLFMDSDDTYEPGSIDRLYYQAVSNQLDGLFFEAKDFDEMNGESGIKFDYSRPTQKKGAVATGQELFVDFVSENTLTVSPCLYLIRREIVGKINFFPNIHYEDNLFTFQLLMSESLNRCQTLNEALYNRRVRYGSIMTGEKTSKHLEGYYQVYLGVCDYIRENREQLHGELLICILRFKARLMYKISLALVETRNLYSLRGIKVRYFLFCHLTKNIRYLKISQLFSILIPEVNLVRGFL